MSKKRPSFTREFKQEAVSLVTDKGYSVSEASRALWVGKSSGL
ncbi:transposase [Zhongshania sp.]|jgi:transposase